MSKRILLIIAIASCVTLGMFFSGCDKEPEKPVVKKEIKVGAIINLTGPASTWGQFHAKGHKDYFKYVNEERYEEFYGLFDPDVEFHAPPNYHVHGVKNAKLFYQTLLLFAETHVDTPEEILISGNKAAVLVKAEAEMGFGNSLSFYAMDLFTIENGKIKSMRIFFDVFSVMAAFFGQELQ